jgi:group I intron endonuclease
MPLSLSLIQIYKEKKMKNYTVYKHTNLINSKVYIGITMNDPKIRWKNGSGYKGQYIYQDIETYGWDNFTHEIIATNLSMAEANELERNLVEAYRSDDENYGYNKTKGGFGSTGREWTEEQKQHMSEIQKECWQDEERRKQASLTQTELWSSEAGRAQRSAQATSLWQNEEYRNKHSGENHARSKPVRCKETGQIFDNARQAAAWALKANPQNIGKCCKGERQHCGNHPETNEKLSWEFI